MCQREPFTGRDKNLPLHQVDPGHHLGNRMFHLKPRVHLHEVVGLGSIAVQNEFDGSGAEISNTAGDLARGLAHRGPQLRCQQWRGRFFDHLLVPPLQTALTLAQVHHVTVGITEDLNLNMPGAGQITLDKQGVVTEDRGGLAPGCDQRIGHLPQIVHHPHALATAARGRLDDQRGPDLLGGDHQLFIRECTDAARHNRLAGRGDGVLGPDLVAHRVHRFGGRPDEDDARRLTRTNEIGILRDESVSGVHSVGTRLFGGADDRVDVEVARGFRTEVHRGIAGIEMIGVPVGVDGDRSNPHGLQRGCDAYRDLAAVGDKH